MKYTKEQLQFVKELPHSEFRRLKKTFKLKRGVPKKYKTERERIDAKNRQSRESEKRHGKR